MSSIFRLNELTEFKKINDLFWRVHYYADVVGSRIRVECVGTREHQYWNCSTEMKIGVMSPKSSTITNQVIVNHTFTNHTTMSNMINIEGDVADYGIILNIDSYSTYIPEMISTFFTPTPNISDAQLIVENQTVHVCKKILAQYSTYFYDLFFGKSSQDNIHIYHINDISCNVICLFLALLHNQENVVTAETLNVLCDVSKRFQANLCLEQCEKFAIRNDDGTNMFQKLLWAEKWGFKVLRDSILERLKTEEDFQNLKTNNLFDLIGHETKSALFKRQQEINSAQFPEHIIILSSFDDEPRQSLKKQIESMFWSVTFSKVDDVKIRGSFICNFTDHENPWRCKTVIAFLDSTNMPLYTMEDVIFQHSKPSVVLQTRGSWNRVSIRIKSIVGMFSEYMINFKNPRDNLTDVALVVDGNKYHVSRQILASQCGYFNNLFYSDFREKGKDEIELKEIDAKEFEDFLRHVYTPGRKIDTVYFDSIFKLSHFYDATNVIRKCQRFLEQETCLNPLNKLRYSTMYNMDHITNDMLLKFKTKESFENFMKAKEFSEFSSDIVARIALNVMEHLTNCNGKS